MIFEKGNEKLKQEIKDILENSDDKTEAIVQALEKYNTAAHQNMVEEIKEEAAQAEHDEEYRKSLQLRKLSKKEKEFYGMLKSPKQAITADQVTIIPEETIDYTLANVKQKSRLSELITFAPATVKKWILAEKSGKASWGGLTDKIVEELSTSFETINYELGKLSVALIIPKAIRDLAEPFVDKYFTAVLEEVMNDGIETGYFNGTGVHSPIGVFKKTAEVNEDKTARDKTLLTNIKGFAPKQIAEVLVTLTHKGTRSVSDVKLVCNPIDKFKYVDPALFGETREGGYAKKSAVPIDVIDTPNCPEGKAGFTIAGYYSMGFSGLDIQEYKETKALDDANVLIAKVYGNGRAVDDDVFVPFDPTKLEEFIPRVSVVGEVATKASA